MSHYARNHLQDDWAAHAEHEAAQRRRAAERTARWYFEQVTRRQRSVHQAGLSILLGSSGPAGDSARDELRRRFAETTADARTLYEATVTCLLDTGEVSDELDEAWTALCEQEDAVARTSG